MRTLPILVGGGFACSLFAGLGLLLVAPMTVAAAAEHRADTSPSAIAYAEIPPTLLPHYQAAGQACRGLPWQVVAAIGAVESGHGTFGGATVDPVTGDVRPPIVGPALDGRPGVIALRDPSEPDGWAHAHGPMQFLTSTWKTWATLGEGRPSGARPDMDNAFDAIATAGAYLCGGHDDLDDVDAAIRRYNNSQTYVDKVLEKAVEYGLGATAPDGSDPLDASGETIDADVGRVLAFAKAQLGKPYVWGAEGPNGFDCSGLVLAAYRTIGIRLPHSATAQARYGRAIDPDTDGIEAGDLVFTRGGSPVHDLGHVGIALDDQTYIVAPRTGDVIRIRAIPDQRVQAVRRLVTDTTSQASTGDVPDPYTDPATAGGTDTAGLRWHTTVINRPVTRTDAIALANTTDRIAATPVGLAAHLTPMKAANPRLAVLSWIDPGPVDITQTPVDDQIVNGCLRSIDASGYDGCLLNLPLIPPQCPTTDFVPPSTTVPLPVTAGGTATTAPTTVPAGAPCPSTTSWQAALQRLVTALTNRPDTDGQLLVLINSDGSRPIVAPAA